jgi:hypothetical protein
MTLDQIDRMVRQANPVPDLKTLEPVDASVLALNQQRRTEMQTHDRVEVDQEPEKPGRRLLTGIAAAAIVIIGALVLFRPMEDAPVATQPATPTEIVTAFLEAYAAYDADKAASYLISGAWPTFGGNLENLRLESRWNEAIGFKFLFETCTEEASVSAGTIVLCPYDFHALRSDELALGPFTGSYFHMTVAEGKIISATDILAYMKGFAGQVWEPFAAWVAENHPDDVLMLYTDPSQSSQRITEESIALWEQRTREYVEVVGN